MTRRPARPAPLAATALVLASLLPGCAAPQRNWEAIRAYYRHDFTGAREALREDAARNDEDVLLNNLRLGLAALADDAPDEAERTLGRAFDLLSTAGLNRDRTTAAILVHEGVRIWKGEPFEQALAYYWVAALYATMGDWENVRAAAANALFRLTDFGEDQTPRQLARRAARDADYLERGYTAVDTNFALGFLMQAIGSELSGAPGGGRQLEAAVEIDADLRPVAEAIRAGDYDTLLLVDYGKGPTKIAYGPDDALVRFVPQERHQGPLVVTADGAELMRVPAACNVNALAVDHRWNNLEDVRRAKSAIGNVLLYGGGLTTAYGAHNRDAGTALAGVGLMVAGLLSKAGARADTRYLEFAPQTIYVAPLRVGGTRHLRIAVAGDPGSTFVLPNLVPGEPGAPRAVYVRLHGLDSPPRR